MFRICNSKYSSSTHVTKMPNTTRTMITTRSLTVTIINNGQVISDQPSPQGGDSLYQTWDNMFRNLEPFCHAYATAHTPQVSYHVWVISEPSRLVGRLLTSSDFIVFLHR